MVRAGWVPWQDGRRDGGSRGRRGGAMTRSPASGLESPMVDAQVIDRVLAGERELYQVLVRRHQTSLFRIAYSMVLDPDVAADLVQDAFVRAYVNLARCRDRERFRSWLVTILRHRALDHAKER